MAAALAAHDAGASVALVERWDRIGGTSAISGGVIWVADNPRMRAGGMEDSREDALAYFRSLDHGDLVDETLEAFVDRGPEALAFLEDAGALSVSVLPGYPDYTPTGRGPSRKAPARSTTTCSASRNWGTGRRASMRSRNPSR